jgi:pimeloyl-ACP methyl ester carboxylesterase
MPRIDISGVSLEYELLGAAGAPAIAITPGGRMSKEIAGVREFGEALVARGKRVLLWDRPNSGLSGLSFEGETESELQARLLIGLIEALELGRTALAGGSAGSRTGLIAAARAPEAVSHLVQWWISGGGIGLMMLGASYYAEPAIAASMGGMEAVAQLPIWSEQMRTPGNREALLSLDPAEFIATMKRWASAFVPSDTSPVPGMTREDFARLTMPVLLFRGSPRDLYHPAEITERVHALIPHSTLVDPPWPDDAYARRMIEGAKTGTGFFLDWPLLAPTIADFVDGN